MDGLHLPEDRLDAKKTFARLHAAGWQFSIGVRMQPHVRKAVELIDEAAWVTLEDYPESSIAQIAETQIGAHRMIVRRVRALSAQGELLPSWQHYPVRHQPHREPPGRRA